MMDTESAIFHHTSQGRFFQYVNNNLISLLHYVIIVAPQPHFLDLYNGYAA